MVLLIKNRLNLLKKFFEDHPAVNAWIDTLGEYTLTEENGNILDKEGFITDVPEFFMVCRILQSFPSVKKYVVWGEDDDKSYEDYISKKFKLEFVRKIYIFMATNNTRIEKNDKKNQGIITIYKSKKDYILHLCCNDSPLCAGYSQWVFPYGGK